ncbi:MAG: hypothetical protein II208_00240 [Alphaproteobacteria bacterium]|nr:hypothetical protein [Alphaproteobacteria bacterium]
MTSKLKCPVCQQDLRKLFNRYTGEPNCDYECGNFDCELYGIEIPESVWKAVTQKLEDLKIARKALKDARIFASTHCIASAVKTIDKALEQIEHKE